MSPQQLAWLQGHLSGPPPAAAAATAAGAPGGLGARRTDISLLADMLAGGSERGRDFSPEFYGCLLSFVPVGYCKICRIHMNEILPPFGQPRPLQGGNLARVANLKEADYNSQAGKYASSHCTRVRVVHEVQHHAARRRAAHEVIRSLITLKAA